MKLEKYKYTFILAITLIMTACADDRSGLQKQEVMKNETLEMKLVEKGNTNLFLLDDLYLQDIWQEGKNVKEFELIVKSESSSLSAKFLANEVLNYYSISSHEYR